MSSKIVVAGVTSLYLSVGVDGFPMDYAGTRTPSWGRWSNGSGGPHSPDTAHSG